MYRLSLKHLPVWIALLWYGGATLAADAPRFLTFQDALRLARDRQIETLVADRRVSEALARFHEARASLLPQVSASASQWRQTRNLAAQGLTFPGIPNVIGPFNSFDARLKLTQTIFDRGAVERLRGAQNSRLLSEAEHQKARQDAMALVATLYVEALRAQQGEDLAQAQLRRDESRAKLAYLGSRIGTSADIDSDDAQAALAGSQQRLLGRARTPWNDGWTSKRRWDYPARSNSSSLRTKPFRPFTP